MSAKSRGRKGNAKGTTNRRNTGGFKKGVEVGKIGNDNATKGGAKAGAKKDVKATRAKRKLKKKIKKKSSRGR